MKKIQRESEAQHLGRQITNNKMRWYGHILRMNGERILKKVLNMNVKGKLPRAHKTK
jgi:hypothetical protein